MRTAIEMTSLAALGCILSAASVRPASGQQEVKPPVIVENPDPDRLPSLSVHVVNPKRPQNLVRIGVPTVPDFECDVWCYESPLEPGEALPQDDGSLVLRQPRLGRPDLVVVTHVVPSEGAVTFDVTARLKDPADRGALGGINPCWQLQRARGFCSKPDPFPEFVKRCFIFTDDGRTFMGDTPRFPDTRRPADDRVNNPPWVQRYVPVWRKHPGQPKAFWGVSTTRYSYPLIGCVSRDGKWLAAMGTDNGPELCQGWHDCLHPEPAWSWDGDAGTLRARFKLYVMENSAQRLLSAFARDFPDAMRLNERRVPE